MQKSWMPARKRMMHTSEGQYLAKTYLEVKGRPVYLLRDSGGGDGHEGAD